MTPVRPAPPGRPLSAEERIAKERREAAVVTRHALGTLSETREETAARIDQPRSKLSQYIDEGEAATLRIHEAKVLGGPASVAIAEYVAGPGHVVFALPEDGVSDGDLGRVLAAQKETSEAVSATLEAIQDGVWTAQEGRTVEKEVLEAIRALGALLTVSRQAQREGVMAANVRRIGGAK